MDRANGAGIVGGATAPTGTSIDVTNRNDPPTKDERQGKSYTVFNAIIF